MQKTVQLKRGDVALIAALIVISLLVALPILTYPMGRDQGMYANIARTILDGGLPFIDMWDIKPPAIYYIYAAGIAVFGEGAAAIRVIDLVFMPFTLLALYSLALRLTSGQQGAAFLTGVLFTVFYFTETFASLTQSDSLVTMPMTLAVLCVVNTGDHPRASRRALQWSAAAGGLCAAVIWFKHYYALFVLALVIQHVWTRFAQERRFPIREALAFCAGGLPVGAIPLLYFVSTGIWEEMLIVAQGTAQYNAQASNSFGAFLTQIGSYLLFRWWHWGVLLLLAGVWLPMTALLPNFSRRGWRVVWLWLAAGLGFVLIQAKGFDTHWIPMLPPLALLAGASLNALIQSVHMRPPVRAALTTVAVIGLFGILAKDTWIRALPYLTRAEGERAYYRNQNFQANDLKPSESVQIIRYLQRNTVPGDTLYIWGFRPEIYYLAGLRPATRFQAQFPLVADWWQPEWREEVVETLWAALPPYVLVLQSDSMQWVTGKTDDSAWLLAHDQRLQDLEDWLIYHYEREETTGDFQIWKRKPASKNS